MLSHLEISVAVSLVPVAKKGRPWQRQNPAALLADPNSLRSMYGGEIKSYSYRSWEVQVYVLRIRLRADKANLTKRAFGTERAKGSMWELMREKSEVLKVRKYELAFRYTGSKRWILKETVGRVGRVGRAGGTVWVTRLSRKIALQTRSSGTQSKSFRKNRTGT